jgi:archaellum component FlaC
MAIRSLGTVNFDLSVFYIGLTPTYTDIALYPASTLENPPAATDVRSGVVYGIGDAYTGEMVVPIEGHVIQGLEYDINKIGQLPVAQTISSQDVTDIMSNIANIEIKIDNVDDKIDTIDTSINTVNNNISNMNIDINTIENELDTAITNINTIDGKVDVIDGKIDTLPTDTLNELKQDDLGERLSKVGTIEEMTNIIINS